jgi:hypothetical protein
MMGLIVLFLILAFISFVIAVAKASSWELRLIALGLALWILAVLLPILQKLGG